MSRTKSPLLGKSDHFVRDIIDFWSIWWPPKHIIHFESITKVRLWLITSKKERLNRSQRPKPRFVSFQQRTVTNYIEKEKTEPFPKTQASFRFMKKTKLHRSPSQDSTCCSEKDKTAPFAIPIESITKVRLLPFQYKKS